MVRPATAPAAALTPDDARAWIAKVEADLAAFGVEYAHVSWINATYINQYVKYLADRRLEELGFEAHYNVTNPAKWMAAANDTLQLVNFFESTNTSYESNASATTSLTWMHAKFQTSAAYP